MQDIDDCRSDNVFDKDWEKAKAAREAQEEGGAGGGPPVLAVSVEADTDAVDRQRCHEKPSDSGSQEAAEASQFPGSEAAHGSHGAVLASAVRRDLPNGASQSEPSSSGMLLEGSVILRNLSGAGQLMHHVSLTA